jgi:sugar phosphate permease
MRSRWTRLLPVMMIAFIIAFLDRTNIGFAIPTMGKELGLTSAILGFASGVLFLGYGASQPFGGWVADRGHGKALIAVLMLGWGLSEMAQAFVSSPNQLVAARFALGFFEGGIFPTLLLFVRNWFAPSERARANGVWQLAYPLAAVISGPIAGYTLQHYDWRMLFIVEGLFPIVWLLVWLWGVAESPARASWLSPAERAALEAHLAAEPEPVAANEPATTALLQMRRRPVLLFTLAIFFWNIGFLGFIIWLPSVLKQDASLSETTIGLLSALPFAAAMVVMQVLTRLSDRWADRRSFSAIPIGLCGATLAVAALSYGSNTLVVNMALLTLAGSMLYGSQPVLWSIPGDILPRRVAAATTGFINGIGVLGAFTGPYVVGYARSISDNFATGLAVMGVCLIISAGLLFSIAEIAPRLRGSAPGLARQNL